MSAKQTHVITIRMTEDLHRTISKAAHLQWISINRFCTNSLMDTLGITHESSKEETEDLCNKLTQKEAGGSEEEIAGVEEGDHGATNQT